MHKPLRLSGFCALNGGGAMHLPHSTRSLWHGKHVTYSNSIHIETLI